MVCLVNSNLFHSVGSLLRHPQRDESDLDMSYMLQVATYVMLIGQPFALAAGVALIWTRLFYAERIARRFKDAKAAGVLKIRHRFHDAHEVEICAR